MRWSMKRYESTSTKVSCEHASPWYKFPMRMLLVSLLLVLVLPAYGSILLLPNSGVTTIAPPTSLLPGALTSDSTIFGFTEQTNLFLTSNLTVAISSPGTYICCAGLPGGTIDAGTEVASYALYASPVTDQGGQDFRDFQGSFTVGPGQKILGIIIGYKNLANTDLLLGAPGTMYPPRSQNNGGLENTDEVILGANSQSVYVNFHVAVGGDDMIRILTSTPEPADFILLGSGLLALALFGRRFTSARTQA
jgi:hypothetical protein